MKLACNHAAKPIFIENNCMMDKALNRRRFIHNSAFLAGIPLVSHNFSPNWTGLAQDTAILPDTFPSQDTASVRAVVGAAHARFETVKEMVLARPALAKAVYDWGYGDWESALGAAAHMGRKDIAEFLIEQGARPDIFTLAMLGKKEAVKAAIESMPGIQKIPGPHGITLMQHAKSQLRRDGIDPSDKSNIESLVQYLDQFGDADNPAFSMPVDEDEKSIYLGKYVFGEGEADYFEVKLNRRGLLSMARGDDFGRVLLKQSDHVFAPGGSPAVRIIFDVENDLIRSVTVHDPMPLVKAVRV